MNKNYFERYGRQLFLPSFGKAAQDKLTHAHVLIIGMGGLGCPVAQYLVGAGIGRLTMIDDDIVKLSNLHRQTLYTENDLGKYKVDVAKEKLAAANSDVHLMAVQQRLRKERCKALLQDVDLVIDCSDNFETRYLVDDACRVFKKPLVFGAVSKFEGQLAVFAPGNACYRNVFPEPPASGLIKNCSEEGVVGMLPGIIGSMQAMEALKYLTGIGEVLLNKLLTYEALSQRVYTVDIMPLPHGGPTNEAAFEKHEYIIPNCIDG